VGEEQGGAPERAVKLVDQVGKLITTQHFGAVSSLVTVSAGSPPSLLKAPALGLLGDRGILAGQLVGNRRADDAAGRDRMVAAIKAGWGLTGAVEGRSF